MAAPLLFPFPSGFLPPCAPWNPLPEASPPRPRHTSVPLSRTNQVTFSSPESPEPRLPHVLVSFGTISGSGQLSTGPAGWAPGSVGDPQGGCPLMRRGSPRTVARPPSPVAPPRRPHPPAQPHEPAAPQVTNEITPVLSYSYLAVLVPVFLLTDYLRYTPVLVLQSASFVAAWLLLLLGRSVLHMQLMELCYSVTMAARIAYSSYIFSLVRPARYQRMAGYSRSAALLGVFTSSVLGQLLVSAAGVPFSTLNQASLGLLCCSLVLALFLRRPRRSLFFNRDAAARRGAAASELARMNPAAARGAWRDWTPARMLRELGATAHSPQLRLWSLWWVFNSAAYYLIVYYVHILWNVVHPTADSASVYNGGADAASTLLGRPAAPPPALPHNPARGPPPRGGDLSCPPRCHHLLLRGLCEDPLGAVGQAGHRGRDGGAGGAGVPHVQHQQHLALLPGLRALPRRLPVPRAHRHVS